MTAALHSQQTVVDGIHIAQAFEFADAAARLAFGVLSTDVGKIARQLDTGDFFILRDLTPTWEQLGSGGSVLQLTAGVSIAVGNILAINVSGEAVLASNALSSGNWEIAGVSLEAVTASNPVRIALPGQRVPILFSSAPAASANGTLAFLSGLAGEATLTPSFVSGTLLATLGVIQGADGASTTPDVIFNTQIISFTP
jgi:hypothetical protein